MSAEFEPSFFMSRFLSPSHKLRLLLDLVMTALLLPLMAYSLIGEAVHE